MPEITNTPTASKMPQLLSFTITDKWGRVLVCREPSYRERLRLAEALGEAASNEAVMNMSYAPMWVRKIDDRPVMYPSTRDEVDDLCDLIEVEAAQEVAAEINKLKPDTAEQVKAKAKN